jgi:hypothetical protein
LNDDVNDNVHDDVNDDLKQDVDSGRHPIPRCARNDAGFQGCMNR